MGMRFHQSIPLFPGVRLNISKSGISVSIGGAPITFNIGNRGEQVTTSVPGTGWSWIKRMGGWGDRLP